MISEFYIRVIPFGLLGWLATQGWVKFTINHSGTLPASTYQIAANQESIYATPFEFFENFRRFFELRLSVWTSCVQSFSHMLYEDVTSLYTRTYWKNVGLLDVEKLLYRVSPLYLPPAPSITPDTSLTP